MATVSNIYCCSYLEFNIERNKKMRDRKINGIQHITITSNDLEVTDKFYTEVMGFVKIDRPKLAFGGSWYVIHDHHLQRQQLHVIEDIGYIPDIEDIYPVDHVAFEAEGYGEMMKHLRDCNVEFRFQEKDIYGLMQIFFYDPNAVLIELNYKKSSEWT
jgi:catechol 2,3-dioxygenase-like lactoylglutathione lyase family enzyme